MQQHLPLKFALAGIFFIFVFSIHPSLAQVVNVGAGSYTKTFPGTDQAGRNSFPTGTPQLSGNALGKPVPTNDWWSTLIKENHASNLFTYPYTLKSVNNGLVVSYIPWGVIGDLVPIVVGVQGLSATRTTISDFSDWTITMDWNDGNRNFKTTAGIAMPFLYFTKKSTDIAQVTIASGTVEVINEMIVITNAINGADFAIFAPVGSTWTKTGNIYTSNLNGKDYWSMAFIPLTAANVTAVANEYKKYAYVFPVNTLASWEYKESSSVLRTEFEVITEVKEGVKDQMLIGLLPHQWANLATDSPVPDKYSYASVRGQIKTMEGNTFAVENTFSGILPTLPYINQYSEGFSPALLSEKINLIKDNQLDVWTDSYNEGQLMNRLIQTARIAHEMGNIDARNAIIKTIKDRLQNWLTATQGERAFLFYYNATWTAMIGYPAGHGQDSNLNDHHFHWGYFIHAASFIEQFEPGWAAQWGEMVNLLVRDAASMYRDDTMFPYLRNFSPYAGHCWANGFASFPQGNDQESTSESMQFNSSLIHWGTITGNKAIRDLGIYLYTTEQTAIEEYWFDMYKRNFRPEQQFSLVSRVWGNSYDNGTFWTSDIAASYGIELYPIHGGSLYLGHNHAYVTKLWNEIKANTGISSNQANSNLWHDVMWKYNAFIDPPGAIAMYNSYPERSLKFGISDAQTYYWLHAMNSLGRVDATITANYPIAAAFTKTNKTIYVAHNYSHEPLTIRFSTGFEFEVPPGKLKTSKDIAISGTLTSTFNRAYAFGSVQLNLEITEGTPTKVEFVNGTTVIGTVAEAPFRWNATGLAPGRHNIYARIFDGNQFNISNIVQVVAGNNLPLGGVAWPIPGTIEPGNYDVFEGGNGQNVTYFDMSNSNAGGYRPDEFVDASYSSTEGATVGWIAGGEWLEFTVNVTQTGTYSMAFRYASGNPAGGGPFYLQIDGKTLTDPITVPSTSTTNWSTWATRTVTGIPLTAGERKLRVRFNNGEFNLGKMTFIRTGAIPVSYPAANAGNHVKVVLPETTATLNGSASTESTGQPLSFLWTQVYGPSVIEFSDPGEASPSVSNLVEGVYRVRLMVTNTDQRSDQAEIFIIVSATENILPMVSLNAPANNSTFRAGTEITLSAIAGDFDGNVVRVDFYYDDVFIGSDETAPYSLKWTPLAGNYSITAKAIDNDSGESTSQTVRVMVVPVFTCSGTLTQALEGSFTTGYIYTFETVGNTVTITFELLDNRSGVIAYLWNRTPFSEQSMTSVGNKKFSITRGGLEAGAVIEVACKFAFAGGLAVTRYITYTVGTQCGGVNTDKLEANLLAPAIYPNPVNDKLFIRFAGNVERNFDLSIIDINGKIIQHQLLVDETTEIDTSRLGAGIYFIHFKNQKEYFRRKLLIAR